MKKVLFALLGVVLATGTVEAASVFSDGFEACTTSGVVAPPGWSVGGPAYLPVMSPNTNAFTPSHTGSCTVDLGPAGFFGDNGGYMEMTVSGLTVGDGYLLSFWHSVEPLGFSTSDSVLGLSGAASLTATITSSNALYQEYQYGFTATGTSLTMRFTDASTTGYNTLIDDVSLESTGATAPEPGTTMLLGAAALVVFGRRVRRSGQ